MSAALPRPVSVVVPALDDRELLAAHLPLVVAELVARNAGDEIVVVDDTGTGALEAWLAARFPPPSTFDAAWVEVRCVVRTENGGYAAAARSGVEAAAHELVLLLNPDVRAESGFLAPLVAALEDETVVAAAGRVLLCGDPSHVETLLAPQWRDGRVLVREHGTLPTDDASLERSAYFPLGGAMLVRRAEFLRTKYDPIYAPFYLEDLDLGFEWRAQGRRIAFCHDSILHHDHRGSIGARAAESTVRAAIEKNLLLFAWKHADEDQLREHFDALDARVLDAIVRGDTTLLAEVALALEETAAAAKARARRKVPRRGFRDLLGEP